MEVNNVPNTCPLCGSKENEKRFSERNNDIFVCHVCELLFIYPYPKNNDERYKTVKNYSFKEIKLLDAQKHYSMEQQAYQWYFPFIEEECRDGTSILDVGCGTGHLLNLLGKSFPNNLRVGIELNSERAKKARVIANCEIYQVPVEEFKSKIKFDVIIMINVLSHISSFDKLFNALRELLNDDGKIILKIGEHHSQVATKGDLFDWGTPDHLHFCGLNTMKYISQKYRLKIIKHQRIPYSQMLFKRERWKSSGRSSLRNFIKLLVASTPYALKFMSKLYDFKHGGNVYSSFFVLSCQ